MSHALTRMNVALLASSGFEEKHLIDMQKAMRDAGARLHVVSTEKGMMMGLNNGQWGHNHTVDAKLNTALGVDYDALVIAGGESSHAKLMDTAHTKRFVGSFLAAHKPVIAMGNAAAMLAQIDLLEDAVFQMDGNQDGQMAKAIDFMARSVDMDEAA